MTDKPADNQATPIYGEATPIQRKTIADLIEVMRALRTPETGCPWDLKQNFSSIAPYTIEEAYEVADAIARGDMADLEEELGDLLLQVVYHSAMAEEQRLFDFHDVAHTVTRKMIRRHPHVFGSPEQRAAGAEPDFWARIKAEEKAEKNELRQQFQATKAGHATHGESRAPSEKIASQHDMPTRQTSLLADVPLTLPALSRAIKLQDKAARVGFDWPSIRPVFDKMREELVELEEVAVAVDPRGKGETAPPSPAEMKLIKEELGDLLFVMANVARHLKLDPEEALRGANEKFSRRFFHIEQRLAAQGRSPAQSDLQEMDMLWDEVRAADKAPGEPVKKSER